MDNDKYQNAVRAAKTNFANFEKTVPESIKEREKTLFARISKSKGNPITKLKRLYSEMEVIYSYLSKFSICKSGCDSCCHQEIALSELEVEYILKNTKAKRKKVEIALDTPNAPCPFLKNHKCSIYAYRPFLCRRHLSIADSSRWCEQDVCHDYEFPHINFSGVDESYGYIFTNNSKAQLHKDIRQVFKSF